MKNKKKIPRFFYQKSIYKKTSSKFFFKFMITQEEWFGIKVSVKINLVITTIQSFVELTSFKC